MMICSWSVVLLRSLATLQAELSMKSTPLSGNPFLLDLEALFNQLVSAD
jgi:hypothetical protein